MSPITFVCEGFVPLPGEEITEQILDLSNWPQFTGYGPIPRIVSAEFEVRTPEVVGTRIRVVDGDGSTHIEEIVEWEPGRSVLQRMQDFSPPLSRLATHFEEAWSLTPVEGGTQVSRTFRLYPKSLAGRVLLWFISYSLKKAVIRHLQVMRFGRSQNSRRLGESFLISLRPGPNRDSMIRCDHYDTKSCDVPVLEVF